MKKEISSSNEIKYFNFSTEPGKNKNTRIYQTNEQPLVSAITIFSENYSENYVNQMYLSLVNQTFPYWEWIIILNEKNNFIVDKFKNEKRVKYIISNEQSTEIKKKIVLENVSTNIIFYYKENNLIDKTFLECGYFSLYFNKEASLSCSKIVNFGLVQTLRDGQFLSVDEGINDGILIKIKDGYQENCRNNTAIKMQFYGYWNRITYKEKLEKEHIISKDNSANELNIIDFETNYRVDYSDVPTIIDIKRKEVSNKNGKKKILFILPWTAMGGAEIFDYNLIKGLKQKGYEISVITTQKCKYVMRQKFEELIEEYFDLTTFLNRKDWASFIAYIIKSRQIELVFLTNSYYGYYSLPWLKYHFKNIPFIDYIHSENWTLRNGGKPKDSNTVAEYLDKTFVCTEYLKDLMYNKMKRNIKNVKTVYIGTDPDFFDPNKEYESENNLKELYKDKKVILFPCRIVYGKRPIFAVEVIKKLSKIKDNVCLVVVGDGEALEHTKKYVLENNLHTFVDFYGYQPDVRPFYKIADTTLICSLQEGIALVAYESLSMGVPVISSDVGGQRELINEDCGRLIKSFQKLENKYDFDYTDEEIQLYVNAILEIFEKNKKTNIKQKCRNKIIKNFSIKNMVDILDKEISKLIKKRYKNM